MAHPQVLPLFDHNGIPLTGRARDLARKKYWYKNNPEALLAIRKREYKKNLKRIRSYSKNYYKSNQERIKERAARWVKDNPERYSETKKIYNESHRKEACERAKLWHKTNPEKARAHSALTKVRRKSRLQKVCDSPMEMLCVYRQFKESPVSFCFYCGENLSGRMMHVDHITPIIKGGRHSAANVAQTCPKCNLTKNEHDIADWFGDRPVSYEI